MKLTWKNKIKIKLVVGQNKERYVDFMYKEFLSKEEIGTIEKLVNILDDDKEHFKNVKEDIETYKNEHQDYMLKIKRQEENKTI